MNRTTISLITVALLTIGVNGHGETIPDKVDINLQQSNPALAGQWQDKKTVKEFAHLAHIEMLKKDRGQDVCLVCHKEVDDRAAIMANDRKAKQQEAVIIAGGVKKYMHGQCLACHKTLQKQKETTGPTSCNGCH